MGFEIKNICTVVPNAYHPSIDNEHPDTDHFYFSVFITPRLQFDGKLKEFYEMMHWPQKAASVFQAYAGGFLQHVNLINEKHDSKIGPNLENDDYFKKELWQKMGLKEKGESIDPVKWLDCGKKIWNQVFSEETPVEAWPIYLKPHPPDKIQLAITEGEKRIATINDLIIKGIKIGTSLSEQKKDTKTEIEKLKREKAAKFHEKNKFRQEFHTKISALSRYPHILRLLGLIQDFKIQKNKLPVKIDQVQQIFLKLNVDFSNYSNKKEASGEVEEFKNSVQFICPFTNCQIIKGKTSVSTLAASTANEKSTDDYAHYVSDGFLRNIHAKTGKPIFEVDQDYYEDRSSSFVQDTDTDPNSDVDTVKVVGINSKTFDDKDIQILQQKVNNQPKISKGFSIKVRAQPGDLLTSMDDKLNQLTDKTINSQAFLAHHLDCGYRVDVNVTGGKATSKFLSLCRRSADYALPGQSPANWLLNLFEDKTLFNNLEDEPWLEEVRQANSDGMPDRFEEIGRWNGWSLTCPTLKNNQSAPCANADELQLLNIKPIDLPKLRFGETYAYQFRIRTVDICGNGVRFCKNDAPAECIFDKKRYGRPLFYERIEQIGTPLFFPPYEIISGLLDHDKENTTKKINGLYCGEDNSTLVFRSRVVKEMLVPAAPECIRFITPQYVTAHFAELSGQFEQINNNAAYLHNLLKEIPSDHYPENEIEKGIPFPVDTMITSFQISDNISIPVPAIANEPKRKPCKISLKDDGLYFPNNSDIHAISLKAGESKKLQIISKTGSNLISASKAIILVHAVQKPVLQSGKIWDRKKLLSFFQFRKIVPHDDTYRDEQKYIVELDTTFLAGIDENSFPFETSGELSVSARYHEYEMNPLNEKGWSYISQSHPKEKNSSDKTSTTQISEADPFIIRKSWSNIDNEDEEGLLKTFLEDKDCSADTLQQRFQLFRHSYPDTKFRRVNYSLEAVSKFASFFDPEKHNLDKNESHPFSEQVSLDKEGETEKYTIIKNSAKPGKPMVTSIIPLFTSSATSNGEDYHFEHKMFRAYLGKIWYETGLEESIAVIYKKDNPLDEPDGRKNKTTIIANDPTTEIDKPYGAKSSSYIDSTRELTDSVNINIIDQTIDSVLKNPPPAGADKGPGHYPDDHSSGFSVFPVAWDMEQEEFFADITVNIQNADHYSTLFKFAICRYQPYSISSPGNYDYRFSDIVLTDMVYLFPSRRIRISNGKILFEGTTGKRYSYGYDSKPNKIYLIQEQGHTEENISDILNNECKIEIISPQNDFDMPKHGPVFIEEYEDIEVSESFRMNEKPDTRYNPRNDPSKRLVFFYKIK